MIIVFINYSVAKIVNYFRITIHFVEKYFIFDKNDQLIRSEDIIIIAFVRTKKFGNIKKYAL